MSERAVSTAVSDLVLAGCSFYAAVNVHGKSVYAAWGFLSVSIAASFGVLKFGVVFPNVQSKVIRLHVLFTWIASTVGRTSKMYYSPLHPKYKEYENTNRFKLIIFTCTLRPASPSIFLEKPGRFIGRSKETPLAG